MKKVAILGSGSGSNAFKIMEYAQNTPDFEVALVVANRSKAGILDKAASFDIENKYVSKADCLDDQFLVHLMESHQIDVVVLAGYLLKIPVALIQAFEGKMLNIHPALLPKYGGKGMYGMHVHEAVKAANEPVSGITIHHVTANYDEGGIIFQHSVQLLPTDSAQDIQQKVLAVEHEYYPKVIHQFITG